MKHQSAQIKPFGLFSRPRSRGLTWYYRVFDDYGRPAGEWSTGLLDRAEAEAYCWRLHFSGTLNQTSTVQAPPAVFKDYFRDWFLWPKDQEPRCPYTQKRIKRGLTPSWQNTKIQRGNLTKHLLPAFGSRRIDRITRGEVESWYYALPEGTDDERGMSNQTATNIFATLRKMMAESCRLGHITTNPCAGIAPLAKKHKARDIPRLAEVDALFSRFTLAKVWPERMAYVGNLLAAVTGMRAGEILALKADQIFSTHIAITRAWDSMGAREKTPKNGETREVPITKKLHRLLTGIVQDDGYVFSLDGGTNPVPTGYFRDHFYTALDAIGVEDEQRRDRNLVFHGWRIFANTMFLQVDGLTETVIRKYIGHMDETMTAHYCNIPMEEYGKERFPNLAALQNRILKVVA